MSLTKCKDPVTGEWRPVAMGVGATFTPHVSEDGTLSWSNDRDLPNPAPIVIKGADGAPGKKGDKGDTGESGITAPINGFFTLSVDDDGNLWAYSEEGNAPNLEYDSETGNLYVVHEQG